MCKERGRGGPGKRRAGEAVNNADNRCGTYGRQNRTAAHLHLVHTCTWFTRSCLEPIQVVIPPLMCV